MSRIIQIRPQLISKYNSWIILLCLVIFIVVNLLTPHTAFAHATALVHSPPDSSTHAETPTQIEILFSERIELTASSIKVFGPDGNRLDSQLSHPDDGDRYRLSQQVEKGGTGLYTVAWQVISADDGHHTEGSFSFSVGEMHPSHHYDHELTHHQQHYQTSLYTIILAGIEVIGQSLVLGGLISIIFLMIADKSNFLQKIILVGCFTVVFTCLSYFFLQINQLSAKLDLSYGQASLDYLLTRTGSSAILRAIFASLIAIFTWKKFNKLSYKNVYQYALLALIGLVILVRATVSHAAASSFLPQFSVMITAIHLFFKQAWIGTVLAISILLILKVVFNRTRTNNEITQLNKSLSKFHILTNIALGLGGATGAYVIWLHLKTLDNLLTTPWGQRCLVLTLLAAIFLFCRLVQQLHFWPKYIQANDKLKLKFLNLIKFSWSLEVVTGLLILILSSQMMLTSPPMAATGMVKVVKSNQFSIKLEADPIQKGFFFDVKRGPLAQSVELRNVLVLGEHLDQQLPPIQFLPVLKNNRYFLPYWEFAMDGLWQLEVVAQPAEGYDIKARFIVELPQDTQLVAKQLDLKLTSLSILAAICLITIASGLVVWENDQKYDRS